MNDEVKDKLCNLCGLTLKLIGPASDFNEISGLVDCKVSGGYDSTPGNGEGALDDTMEYKFSLCEFCLDWLFCQFQIPVEVSDYWIPPTSSDFKPTQFDWIPAKDRVNNDDWRKMKKKFFAEFEKRNLARNKPKKIN
jgi:hypothetical protein